MSKSQPKTARVSTKHQPRKASVAPAVSDRFKFRAVIHEAEEGGYWAEGPGFHGCVSEAETLEEMRANIREAFLGVLEVMQDRGAPSGEPGLTEEILV
jgi:predicted RNase H-like HicB family nuclease